MNEHQANLCYNRPFCVLEVADWQSSDTLNAFSDMVEHTGVCPMCVSSIDVAGVR